MISGSVVFRNTLERVNGKRLMMFVGVVAVPDDTSLKGEHQYAIIGSEEQLVLHGPVADLTERAKGRRAGDLLCDPIWRV